VFRFTVACRLGIKGSAAVEEAAALIKSSRRSLKNSAPGGRGDGAGEAARVKTVHRMSAEVLRLTVSEVKGTPARRHACVIIIIIIVVVVVVIYALVRFGCAAARLKVTCSITWHTRRSRFLPPPHPVFLPSPRNFPISYLGRERRA